MTGFLFGPPAAAILEENHYLGASQRAMLTYHDNFGVVQFARPASRQLPNDWLELVRWCLTSGKDGGSQQWHLVVPWLLKQSSSTTVVSYSDPSVGHTGALYRACNWLWAPTWHRLRPPPTGNGRWTDDATQGVKDRWVYPLRPDQRRADVLAVKDDAVMKLKPWAQYREPRWKRGRPNLTSGGGNYRRFRGAD